MTRDIDEQNLTAYVLGELPSPDDRAAVGSRLAAEPAARRQLEHVRAAAAALAHALAEESAGGPGDDELRLTDLHRAAIERRLVEPGPPARRRRNGRHWPLWGSIAASMAIVATVTATVVVPLFRGTFGDGGRKPGIRPGGPDVSADAAPPPAAALPGGGPESRLAAPAGGATRQAWADLPMQWPGVPDVPFPGAGVPARGGGSAAIDAPRNPGFIRVADRPVSPCPIAPIYPNDVGPERGSFAAVRRSLEAGQLPPAAAVRTEELINALAGPHESPNTSDAPALDVEVAACPWAADHRLVLLVLTTARDIHPATAAPATRPSLPGDVSLHVEFDPAAAAAYHLIGYDDPDARPTTTSGVPEIPSWPPAPMAAGQSLTVLFEVIPAPKTANAGPTLAKVVLRFRDGPTGPRQVVETTARDNDRPFPAASPAFRAAAAAAAFGMALRDDPLRGAADYDLPARLLGLDPAPIAPDRARVALFDLARRARALSSPPTDTPSE